MSTNIREQTAASTHKLEAALPDWCALTWHQALTCGLFVAAYIYFCYIPVFNPQTWHEVVSGKNAIEIGNENLAHAIPLSVGMRHAQTNWLGAAAISFLHSTGGPELLSLSFAILQTCTLICWSIVFCKLSNRWLASLGCLFVLGCCLYEFVGMQSQTFGLLAFSGLALLLVHSKSTKSNEIEWANASFKKWLLVAALFCLWANLHASVVVGILWLACLAMSRLFACFDRNNFAGFLSDREFRSRVWLLELAILTTIVNPIGIQLWKSAFWWPDNPFIHSLGGWAPTLMASWVGIVVAAAWLVWFIFARSRSHNKLSPFWTSTALFATVAVACCQSCIVWFAPLMVAVISATAGQKAGVENQRSYTDTTRDSKPGAFRFAFTLIAGLVLWLGFCLTPSGAQLLGGPPRTAQQVLGNNLPRGAKAFLTQNQPNGILLSPSYWSDWLQADQPLQVFVNNDSSLVPAIVAQDYQRIFNGEGNWRKLAEQYALSAILIDKTNQPNLVRHLRRRSEGWQIAYEDDQAMILRRVE